MRRMRLIALVLLAALALVSCNRDPNVAKKRYVESGNKYFEKGRFKEASIQYRNAIKIDPRFGEAHYRLALTAMRLQPPDDVGAARSLRRAVELIPEGDANRWEALARLAELYIRHAPPDDEASMKEASSFCDKLLQHDPNSFDGHRLTGDVHFHALAGAIRHKQKDVFDQNLAAALAEYRRADSIKSGDPGVSTQLASALALSNDLPGAEVLYRAVLNRDKTYRKAYEQLFQLLLAQKKFSDAEELLKSAYQNNPKQYDYLLTRARFYLFQNRRNDMLALLDQIKSKAGEIPMVYATVGDFYVGVQDGDSAIREYREGVSKDSKNKTVYQKRIIDVLMRQGKRDEAAKLNAAILKENPNDNDCRGLAASFMVEKGDVVHAIVELQQVVSRGQNDRFQNPVNHFNLGRAYYLNGDIDKARNEFTKAIELRADYLEARLALAQLQVTRREFADALKTALDILAIYPNDGTAKLIQSQALAGQNKFDESRQVLSAILKANPASAEAILQTGALAFQEKKYKEAEEAFRKAYELNPANLRALALEANTYVAENQPEKALQRLQTEIQKNPKNLALRGILANILGTLGRYGLAIQQYQQVLAAGPSPAAQGQLNFQIGELYRLQGDFGTAINYFQAARKATPDDPRILTSLALALEQAGRWNEARTFYETALKANPNNAAVLNNLAFGMTEHGENTDQALQYAQRAKQLRPDLLDISDTLGWIHLKKNLPDSALEIFRGLVAAQPKHPTFHYHLAMALLQKGDKAHAREELKKSLELHPPESERQKIQDLLSRQ
jgi:tetratricopeptide (TPR) repeat protein